MYPDGSNKHAKRADLAEAFKSEVGANPHVGARRLLWGALVRLVNAHAVWVSQVVVVPSSRLLAIIGHSLKWQQHLVRLERLLRLRVWHPS